MRAMAPSLHAAALKPQMRKFFDNIKTEFFVTALVMINLLMLLVDMVVTDTSCGIYGNLTIIQDCYAKEAKGEFLKAWTTDFQYVELIFLLIFAIELLFRLYCFGFEYLRDAVNIFDAIIVYSLFFLQIVVMHMKNIAGGSFNFLRIVRLVRLVRLFVVMNKVQKLQRGIKKAKYLKLGSPVERVMELLNEMKTRLDADEDVADITWIMHLIASDKLYTIDIRSAGGANLSTEMTAWLENNMGMKKDIEAEEDDEGEKVSMSMVRRKTSSALAFGRGHAPRSRPTA